MTGCTNVSDVVCYGVLNSHCHSFIHLMIWLLDFWHKITTRKIRQHLWLVSCCHAVILNCLICERHQCKFLSRAAWHVDLTHLYTLCGRDACDNCDTNITPPLCHILSSSLWSNPPPLLLSRISCMLTLHRKIPSEAICFHHLPVPFHWLPLTCLPNYHTCHLTRSLPVKPDRRVPSVNSTKLTVKINSQTPTCKTIEQNWLTQHKYYYTMSQVKHHDCQKQKKGMKAGKVSVSGHHISVSPHMRSPTSNRLVTKAWYV